MEVIACIPHLQGVAGVGAAQVPGGESAVQPAAATGAAYVPDEPAQPTAAVEDAPHLSAAAAPPTAKRTGAGRRPPSALLSPSVVVLAALAATVWAAAWRNDRLRAIEQQRPQRIAMEPPATVGPERSLKP